MGITNRNDIQGAKVVFDDESESDIIREDFVKHNFIKYPIKHGDLSEAHGLKGFTKISQTD